MKTIYQIKKTVKTSLVWLSAILAPIPWGGVGVGLISCNEEPEYFALPTYPDEMHIRSSVEQIVLNKGIADQAAVTFTWDRATSPVSPSDKVSYKLCLYPSATKDQKSEYLATDDTSLTLTHDELNAMVARWALPGEPVRLTAQLLSIVENETRYVRPEVSTVELLVTGYEKYPACLYMILTDADGLQSTQRLEQRQLGTGIYEATLNMVPCTFHFTTTEEPYPAYGMGAEAHRLEYVTEGSVAEFTNDANGQRTVIVDTNQPYCDCRVLDIVQLPVPGQIWICGNGCSIGWNTNAAAGRLEMTGTAREPYYYSWTGEFTAGGEIKIGLGNGWGDQFFFAPEANADPLTDHRLPMYRLQDNGGDLKWVPSVSGRYTFTLCLLATDMHTTFLPAN